MEFHEGCFCFRADEAEEARRSGLDVRCAPGLPCACIVLHDLATAPEIDPLFDPVETGVATSADAFTSLKQAPADTTTTESSLRTPSYSCPCTNLLSSEAKRKRCCGDDCACDTAVGNCTCSISVKCCTSDDTDPALRAAPPPMPSLPSDTIPPCCVKPSAAACSSILHPHPKSLLGSIPNIHTTLLLPGIGDPQVVNSTSTRPSTTATTTSTLPHSQPNIPPDSFLPLTTTPATPSTTTPVTTTTGTTTATTATTATNTTTAKTNIVVPSLPPLSSASYPHSFPHHHHPHHLHHPQCQVHSQSNSKSCGSHASHGSSLTPGNLSNRVVPKKLEPPKTSSTPSGRSTRKRNLVALFQCNDCDATFSTRDASETHAARVHGRNRPYACDKCGAKFLFKQNRDRHVVEVHHGARPHACPKEGCTSTFKNSSALKQHLRTVHEKQRPFKCHLCPSSFGQRNHLSQHILVVHERRKLFHCDICGTSFSNRGNLNQHVRRKHAPKPAAVAAPPPPPPPLKTSPQRTTEVPAVVSTGGAVIATAGIPAVPSPPPELVATSPVREE